MVTKAEPGLGHGVSGWKSRQENSRLKRRSKSGEERARIREIRRRHKQRVAAQSQEAVEQPESQAAEKPTVEPATGAAEIIQHGGGWYTVEVDGKPAHDGKVRKKQAEKIAAELRNA